MIGKKEVSSLARLFFNAFIESAFVRKAAAPTSEGVTGWVLKFNEENIMMGM